ADSPPPASAPASSLSETLPTLAGNNHPRSQTRSAVPPSTHPTHAAFAPAPCAPPASEPAPALQFPGTYPSIPSGYSADKSHTPADPAPAAHRAIQSADKSQPPPAAAH